jgi:hypothetical protein
LPFAELDPEPLDEVQPVPTRGQISRDAHLASQVAAKIQERVGEMIEGGGDMLTSSRPGGGLGQGLGASGMSQTAGGVGEGAGKSISAFGELFGSAALGKAGDFISYLAGGVDAMGDFVKGLHRANMEFADFSGAMAEVKAKQIEREIDLNMQRGDRRAADAEVLAEKMHNMNVQMAKVEDKIAQILMTIGSGLADSLAVAAEILAAIIGADDYKLSDDDGQNMREQALHSLDDVKIEKFGKPDRFK